MAALKETGFHAADAKDARRAGRRNVETGAGPFRDASAFSAYRLIKQQNTFAFYTSRAGMIETLEYQGNSYQHDVSGLQSSGAPVVG